jgi:hypothetical protein
VAEAQQRYSVREFHEWIVYERMFGPVLLHERLDVLFARSDWLLAEINRNRKKKNSKYRVEDFLTVWDKEQRRQGRVKDWRTLKAIMMQMASEPDEPYVEKRSRKH